MFAQTDPPLRYLLAVRRARLRRLAAAGALVVLPAACSTADADVFDAATVAAPATDVPTTDSTATTSPVTIDVPATTAPATTAPSTADSSVPAVGELVVEFTYAASSGGQVHNPYVAVWIEDADGNLVQTVGLWYEQGRGARWLDELRSWYAASAGDALTSGATRAPGAYSVVWDGTDLDGAPVAPGAYVVFVESAREHGPHSITSAALKIDGQPLAVTLADDGELTAASATMSV